MQDDNSEVVLDDQPVMIYREEWGIFRSSGMLWWVNRLLHTFGWALVVEYDGEEIINAYPARTKFRGFSEKNEEEGFKKLTGWIKDNIETLFKESNM